MEHRENLTVYRGDHGWYYAIDPKVPDGAYKDKVRAAGIQWCEELIKEERQGKSNA